MHIPTRSSALYYVRILQIVLALGFLVLICYSGVHRAWWENINGALAVGVIAALFTFGLSTFSIIFYHRNRNPFSGSTIKTVLRVSIEVILFLLYVAAAGLMLRPKGDCNENDVGECGVWNGLTWYPVAPHDAQPATEWNVGIAFSFAQIVSYIVSFLLVIMEDRSSKVGGGVSYA